MRTAGIPQVPFGVVLVRAPEDRESEDRRVLRGQVTGSPTLEDTSSGRASSQPAVAGGGLPPEGPVGTHCSKRFDRCVQRSAPLGPHPIRGYTPGYTGTQRFRRAPGATD
jgi:hypothetical protein